MEKVKTNWQVKQILVLRVDLDEKSVYHERPAPFCQKEGWSWIRMLQQKEREKKKNKREVEWE